MARFETFGDIKQAVAYAIGANSVADLGPARESHVERIINNVVRHIHEQMQFKHLQKRRIFRTFAPVTDDVGVSVVTGATTVTLPAGVAQPEMAGSSVLLGGQDTAYRILTVSGNDLGLYQPYVGDDLTNAAYRVVNSHIILPEDYDVLIKATQLEDNRRIDYIELSQLLDKVGNPYTRSWAKPRACAIDGRLETEAGGLVGSFTYRPWLLFFYAQPDAAYDIQIDYTRMVNEMAATDDEPDLPPQHRQTIYEMTVSYFSSPEAHQEMASMGMNALGRKPPQNPRRRQLGSAWRGGRRYPSDDVIPNNETIWPGGIHV